MNDAYGGLSAAFSGKLGNFSLEVAFEAPARGVTALFGPSGCGKTTVLRCLAGLAHLPGRTSIAGDVWQDTTQRIFVPPHRREIGYVFQEASLFSHLSVRDNLLFGARRATSPKAGSEAGLTEIVDMLAIAHLLDRSPATLSGGERQRVALGRALLSRPRLLLMDEPLSALDRITKESILPYFERMVATVDLPIVYVSHDITEVARLARHVLVMGSGRVARTGPATAIFGGIDSITGTALEDSGAVLNVSIHRQHDDGLTELTFPGGSLLLPKVEGPIGAAVRVRVPARDVMIALDKPTRISALNVLPVIVDDISMGNAPNAILRLRCGNAHILARLTQRSVSALGLTVGVPCYAVLKSVAIADANVGTAMHGRGI